MPRTTPADVMREAELIARPAKERASRAERLLHETGFHAYSAAMSNFRLKIEKAEIELHDELETL